MENVGKEEASPTMCCDCKDLGFYSKWNGELLLSVEWCDMITTVFLESLFATVRMDCRREGWTQGSWREGCSNNDKMGFWLRWSSRGKRWLDPRYVNVELMGFAGGLDMALAWITERQNCYQQGYKRL